MHMQTVCTTLEMPVKYKPLAAYIILVLWQIWAISVFLSVKLDYIKKKKRQGGKGKDINILVICDTLLDVFLESSNTASCYFLNIFFRISTKYPGFFLSILSLRFLIMSNVENQHICFLLFES